MDLLINPEAEVEVCVFILYNHGLRVYWKWNDTLKSLKAENKAEQNLLLVARHGVASISHELQEELKLTIDQVKDLKPEISSLVTQIMVNTLRVCYDQDPIIMR